MEPLEIYLLALAVNRLDGMVESMPKSLEQQMITGDQIIAKETIKFVINTILSPFFLVLLSLCALIARFIPGRTGKKPRLVWGSTPIINYSYWSRAMKKAGFISETFTTSFYSQINKRSDWDKITTDEFKYFRPLSEYIAFLVSIFRYDVFFTSFDGFFLGNTPIRYFQAQILKIAGKKVVVLPYGADSYVYRRIKSIALQHGLMISYPLASRKQYSIARNVDYWVKHADAIIPGFMAPDGFGRWEVLIPSPLFLPLDKWLPSTRKNTANGIDGEVVIGHAPNHRGFKGTEFVIDAVKKLQEEGLKVRLILLEKVQNDEVRRILREDVDILVEQLIFTGHGLNGLEGMASGLPTISNLEDQSYLEHLRLWSYFAECPLVSASPETLIDVLRKLVKNPKLRHEIGKASRSYVEKYHGEDSAVFLFCNVIDYIYGKKDSLINLYHPLLGEYPNRLPKIQHPLVNNRIID